MTKQNSCILIWTMHIVRCRGGQWHHTKPECTVVVLYKPMMPPISKGAFTPQRSKLCCNESLLPILIDWSTLQPDGLVCMQLARHQRMWKAVMQTQTYAIPRRKGCLPACLLRQPCTWAYVPSLLRLTVQAAWWFHFVYHVRLQYSHSATMSLDQWKLDSMLQLTKWTSRSTSILAEILFVHSAPTGCDWVLPISKNHKLREHKEGRGL